MVLLLGASGFVGRAFAAALLSRGRDFIPVSRRALDYTRFDVLFDFVRRTRPRFLINAAGMVGGPDGTGCETAREEALAANTLLPQTIARVCRLTRTPWGHVSSGCIYRGAKLLGPDGPKIETDLNSAAFRRRLATAPETIWGFSEADEPNCSFRRPPCSFYSGTKALAEEALAGMPDVYIWRPGVVFNRQASSRNLLWRLRGCDGVSEGIWPLTDLEDFVRACLTLWETEARYGIYNIVNPGIVTTDEILGLMRDSAVVDGELFSSRPGDVCRGANGDGVAASCVLETRKLEAAGVRLRPAAEALRSVLEEWSQRPREMELLRR
ncbi:MAG: sugar nucleotide-binding protein [Verrucomicrobiae bacterium]|nr:sugar nucleotide-binding protein [Verrucomicrobiae bacterium]